ncbi:MAG TPA: protein tyrosine phosphatase family protein [Burkholderiales bacterium]|nr:protein tyrosine phosphatase family protein [Burkholderiales bacterium]
MSRAAVTDIVNFLRIDPALATSGQPSEEELAAAAHDGTEVVINLALHDDPRYSLADEAGTVGALGMTYVHIPVKFDAPKESELFAFFDAMERHRGRRVLVHCAANKRVTAFLGLYRAIREGWDVERAFAPMETIWEPNAAWAPFIAEMLAKHAPASQRPR